MEITMQFNLNIKNKQTKKKTPENNKHPTGKYKAHL